MTRFIELMGAGFLTLLGIYTLSLVVLAIGKGVRSKAWPSTTGKIISSTAQESHAYHSGRFYTPAIRYRYKVNGIEYESHAITASLKVYFGKKSVEAVAKRYEAESTAVVYYDPNNPKISALERGVSVSSLLIAATVGGIFTLVGLLAIAQYLA